MAYSPTLLLKESYVALYKIYTLKNPFTGGVFYVGQTLQELQTRLSGHIHEAGDVNPVKNEYIKWIVSQGGKPIIEAIETIPGTCRIDKALVNEREIYWIKYYKSIGVKLLNIASTHNEAECREYKDYLSAIRSGQSQYSYYFCGTTYGGHEVYDEKKMVADGFTLPPGESSIVQVVERIIEKIIEVPKYVVLAGPFAKETNYVLPQPDWSPEFASEIPPESYPLEDYDITDYDSFEIDEAESEEDDSDYEPDWECEDEELEIDESEAENYEAIIISTNRSIPFYLSADL